MTGQASQGKSRPVGWWLVGGLLVLGVIAGFITRGDGTSNSRPEVTRFMAVTICEDAVKQHLRAPATAQFPDPLAVPEEHGRWLVRGAVDSQNMFGALVRSEYVCRAWMAPDGDTVRGRVISLEQR